MRNRLTMPNGTWIDWTTRLLLLLGITFLMVFLLSWQLPRAGQFRLTPGQVAPSNIIAPSQISYESALDTERARERAAQNVEPQYDLPEGRVRRQQVDRSLAILEYLSIIRSDTYASSELQMDYVLAIPDLNISQENALQVLGASDAQWADIETEMPVVMGRVMREEIRDTDSSVAQARRKVPTLIDGKLSDSTSNIIAALVRELTRPNSFFNEERTEELRAEARNNVPVQRLSYARDEIILREGNIITARDVEALEQIGLLNREWNWWVVARSILFTMTIVLTVLGATSYLSPDTLTNNQTLALLAVATIVWLLTAKFMIVPHDWLPYLYPLATLGMLLTVLVNMRVAIIFTIAFTFLVLYLGNPNSVLVAYVGIGSLFGSLILGRAERLSAFLWAGLAIALSNLMVFSAFRAPFLEFTTTQLLRMALILMLNGGLSASIALIGYFFLGNIFGITTSLQLTELSRPTHPLLRQLLLKAPGTYHHTIVVSNMAERGAAAIGADALLTRVGAYYHDIGKTVRPYFFIENSADGAENPHDKLDPLTSAQIIISHVADGVDLARKYKIPARLQDFIREHHGATTVRYFYNVAQREAGEATSIDEAAFRYPGPRPQSKETAVLSLADTCESAVRAIRPSTRADMAELINKLIDDRVAEGELNECNLTFKELQIVKDIFIQVLQGVHHPRVVYPEKVKKPASEQTNYGLPAVVGPTATQTVRTVPTSQLQKSPIRGMTNPTISNTGVSNTRVGAQTPLPGGVEQLV